MVSPCLKTEEEKGKEGKEGKKKEERSVGKQEGVEREVCRFASHCQPGQY